MIIHRNGNINLELEYIINKTIARYGRGFGADELWPLPLTEKDFRLQAIRSEGIKIKQYKHRQLSGDRDRIRVKLVADSIEAVADFFNWDIRLERTGKNGELVFKLPKINGHQLQDSSVKILNNLLHDGEFTLRIKPPGKPDKVYGGKKDGAYAIFGITLEKLALTENPVIWSVRW